MTSTQEKRAAFISSLSQFMATYDFQGVDLDWEYPAGSEREVVKLILRTMLLLYKKCGLPSDASLVSA